MSKISRRDLLQYIGAGGIGAVGGVLYGESVQRNVELLVPQVIPPEDYSPGVATWYNTVCNQCSAGCGISVRIREGNAKKIEGNPVHPVSQGRLCARGQAGLNALYNPDRIKAPLQIAGQRGSGNFEQISWDEALTTVGSRIGRLKIEDEASRVRLLSGRVRGHLDELFAQFMDLLGSDHYQQYDFTNPGAIRAANKLTFGVEQLPYYDIKNADFLVSFGADYLGTWLSPVHHSLAYGHLRQGRKQRGKTVQIEPRMSLSGASADEWIAARPGTEGLLALGIAHALVSSGTYAGNDRDEWSNALQAYSLAVVAAGTGVSEEDIARLANEFGTSNSSLAIAGGATAAGTNAVASVVAVNALNLLAGNLGKPGGVIFNSGQAFAGTTDARPAGLQGVLELVAAMQAGDVEVLLVHDTNPVFALPDDVGFRKAMENVPLVVALSSFRDETTELADLVLPTNTYLESWGDDVPDPGVGFPVASISQPVVAPLYDTLSAGDIVLSLARQIGGELPIRMTWGSMEEFIKERWREEYDSRGAAGHGQDFDMFWQAALEAGVWGQPGAAQQTAAPGSSMLAAIAAIADPVSSFAGDESNFPFVLHPYLTATFLDGRGANLPWLQEMPDPMTSVVYGSWAELNPVTAEELGITDGDVLEITSPAGTVRVPALIFLAIMPGVVAMPVGQGHTAYGRYAKNRGVNPIHIVATLMDDRSGDLAWAATRVNVKATGERLKMIKTDGVTRTLGRQIMGPNNDHA